MRLSALKLGLTCNLVLDPLPNIHRLIRKAVHTPAMPFVLLKIPIVDTGILILGFATPADTGHSAYGEEGVSVCSCACSPGGKAVFCTLEF